MSPALGCVVRRALTLLSAGLLAMAPGSDAQAQDSTSLEATISVQLPEPCVTAAGLAARVGVLLGTTAVDSSLRVVVFDADGATGFTIHRGDDVIARRRFDVLPAACDARLAALGLALALALDHTLLERLSAPDVTHPSTPARIETASTTPSPEPAAAAPLPALAVAAAAPRDAATPEPADDADGWTFTLGLDATAWLSVLWAPAFGGRLAFEARAEFAALRVTAFGGGGLSAELGSGHFDSEIAGGQVAGCLAWRDPAASFGGCLGLAAGWIGAQGTDFAVSNLGVGGPWVAASLEAYAEIPLGGPVALRVGIAGVVSLVRVSVTVVDVDGEALASSPSPVAGAAPSLGLMFTL